MLTMFFIAPLSAIHGDFRIPPPVHLVLGFRCTKFEES